MRYLLISDIHANQVAFEAVLAHAQRQQWNKVLFLGDIVGYYTAPEAVTAMLRDLEPDIALMGNHDALLLALADEKEISLSREDGIVRDILTRHLLELSSESRAFIRSFGMHVVRERWEAVHGALRTPWEYMATLPQAQNNLAYLQKDLCFFGHTHVPVVYACTLAAHGEMWRTVPLKGERATYRIPPNARVFFNPGSVGQPRDGVPLASYAIFDEGLQIIELFRVPFDIIKVQRLVREHNYADVLGARLGSGR
jgi:predicted phosphodiesterase